MFIQVFFCIFKYNNKTKKVMKTILRVISREGSEYFDIPNPYNMTPRKDDTFVWKQVSYIVSWVEFDFDTNTFYIISLTY